MNDDYPSIFETLQLDEKTLQMNHGETIVPDAAAPRGAQSSDALPNFTTGQHKAITAPPDFRIVETLGEGGMGVVSLAEQTALRRLVAVKEPKGNDPVAQSRVLDEAFVMGRVEHPNVVPAYGLGRREDGQPILVMKRVEGTSWQDVLLGDAKPPGGGGSETELVWHLRVLLQVCNALRFAHARAIVHRDIKPENVMIGEFGEVYLLDWGVALSVDETNEGDLPTVATAQGVAGTPTFMAPEMTIDDAREIDTRTDVYQLGATLHLLLTGSPPHVGSSLMAVMMSAYQSNPPTYPDSVPSELAKIATRAMAREKADRYPSVTEFADEISDYLEYRASFQLADSARTLLDEISREDTGVDTIPKLLEAEFGFRKALEIHPDNEAARVGLQEALEARVRANLVGEELASARAALEQLPTPNTQLAAEVDALEAELAARSERVDYLEKFERDLDLRTSTRARQRAALVLGLAFAALCFLSAWGSRPGTPGYTLQSWMDDYWRLLLISAIAIGLFRKKLFANVANRRVMTYGISALVAIFVLRFSAMRLEPPQEFMMIAEIAVMGMAATAIGIASSRRLALASLSFAVAAIASALYGTLWFGYTAFGIAHLFFFGFVAWEWRPSRTRVDSN